MTAPGSIFVQIPSYRDTQLMPTLVNMIKNASDPSRLHAVVCWQHAADENIQDFIAAGFNFYSTSISNDRKIHLLSFNGCEITLIDVDYLKTGGCGWARNVIQDYLRQENYSLQLDSHHRFIENWDTQLITMLENLRFISAKPILTGYPAAYDPSDESTRVSGGALQMDFDRFSAPGVIHFKSSWVGNWRSRTMPIRARFISGGFIFGDASFVTDVPNDSNHFFSSEEISMTVRSYVAGYDLYHPHRILLWHYYTRPNEKKVWNDHNFERKASGEISQDAEEKSSRAYQRTRALLGMTSDWNGDFGRFGLRSERSLEDYELFAGISFRHEGVRQEVLDGVEPKDSLPLISYDEWEKDIICNTDVQIKITADDFEIPISDCQKISVRIHTADETEIYSHTLPSDAISELACGATVEYVLNFATSPFQKPKKYILEALDKLNRILETAHACL